MFERFMDVKDMGLKEKAKTAEQIYDEIDEFYITSVYDRIKGMTYREFVKLKEAKWVRLEDAQKEIERIHREYEALISKAEKDCADCYEKIQKIINKRGENMSDISIRGMSSGIR